MMGYGTVRNGRNALSTVRYAWRGKAKVRASRLKTRLCVCICVITERLEKDERRDQFKFQLLNTTRLLI